MAALFVEQVNWKQFWLQFLNVHVLLFGGATAYNSWWDKDEGPIGGLKSPPKMNKWMWPVSLLIQFIGLAWSVSVGWNYAIIYAISMLFFWLYSTPIARWKGKPILSIIAIGISTGTNSFLLGFLAAGAYPITITEDITALGVALIILSLYPVSQVYQKEEDSEREDSTFAIRFGLKGVKWFFAILFLLGAGIISVMLYQDQKIVGMIFSVVTLLAYLFLSYFIWGLEGKQTEYQTVMRLKFLASFSFVLFIVGVIGWQTLSV